MSPPSPLTAAAGGAALLVGVMCSLVPGSSVSAHTDLEFTIPTDGAAVGEPVSEITVGFDEPVTLVGPGFEILDPQGRLLTPFAVTDDDTVFRLQLDPPIGGGEAAVRYEVRAEDGHTISGGVSFTISTDAPTTTVTVPPTPTTTAPASASTNASTSTSTNAPAPTVATTTSLAPATPPRSPNETGDDDARSGAVAAAAAVVAVAAGGFLVVRSRRPPGR